MPNNKLIKIGSIGCGYQFKKIKKILTSQKFEFLVSYHYYNKDQFNNNFKDLFNCDIIFILSPTFTHRDYLKKLKSYKGYIFLEKPGASNIKEINQLSRLFKNRLFINYNFQNSKIFELIKKHVSTIKFGRLLKLNITQTNGVAFKKKFDNWRFDKKKCSGIGEINTVHFLKIIFTLFKKLELLSYHKFNISKKNIDNLDISFMGNEKTIINIYNSYTSPVINQIQLIFENAFINYDGLYYRIYFPRNNFNSIGRLIEPKLYKKFKINFDVDWNLSLKKTIEKVLITVKNKKKFDTNDFLISIKVIKLLFKNMSKKN